VRRNEGGLKGIYFIMGFYDRMIFRVQHVPNKEQSYNNRLPLRQIQNRLYRINDDFVLFLVE